MADVQITIISPNGRTWVALVQGLAKSKPPAFSVYGSRLPKGRRRSSSNLSNAFLRAYAVDCEGRFLTAESHPIFLCDNQPRLWGRFLRVMESFGEGASDHSERRFHLLRSTSSTASSLPSVARGWSHFASVFIPLAVPYIYRLRFQYMALDDWTSASL